MNTFDSNSSSSDNSSPGQLNSYNISSIETSIPIKASVMGFYFGKHKSELVYYPQVDTQFYAVNYLIG